MRHQKATRWHRNRAQNERRGRQGSDLSWWRQTSGREVEHEVHHRQAEKRNMPQPI
jgi:hypothetical protein